MAVSRCSRARVRRVRSAVACAMRSAVCNRAPWLRRALRAWTIWCVLVWSRGVVLIRAGVPLRLRMVACEEGPGE